MQPEEKITAAVSQLTGTEIARLRSAVAKSFQCEYIGRYDLSTFLRYFTIGHWASVDGELTDLEEAAVMKYITAFRSPAK